MFHRFPVFSSLVGWSGYLFIDGSICLLLAVGFACFVLLQRFYRFSRFNNSTRSKNISIERFPSRHTYRGRFRAARQV